MSLQDDRHVATLLGFSCGNRANEDLSESQAESGKISSICKTTDILLKTLLGNLSFQVVGGTSLRYFQKLVHVSLQGRYPRFMDWLFFPLILSLVYNNSASKWFLVKKEKKILIKVNLKSEEKKIENILLSNSRNITHDPHRNRYILKDMYQVIHL